MRERIRRPMTGEALRLILARLDRLADSDGEKIAIVEQSIMNSWQGVFALKGDSIAARAAPDTLEENLRTGARVLAMCEQKRQQERESNAG
jgi:hypothetical protein